MLSPRQNALENLRFGKPDRITRRMPIYETSYWGANHESFDGTTEDCPAGTRWTDIWGVGWEKEMDGIMGMPKYAPLSELAALKDYQWPDPDDERICGQIYRLAEAKPHDDVFLGGSHRDMLFEKAHMLVGMENLMVYMLTEESFVHEIFHRIMDFQLGIQRHYLRVGVELVSFSEDLGAQNAPLISPEMIRELLMPEYERILGRYKENATIIRFHSCGHVECLLDIFQKMEIDILNPVQASANDVKKIRELTAGKIALEGGVDSAVGMDGPPQRIAELVRRRIAELGAQGGYFCDFDQHMPYPPEHVQALAEAVERYGRFPLADAAR